MMRIEGNIYLKVLFQDGSDSGLLVRACIGLCWNNCLKFMSAIFINAYFEKR